MYCHVEVVFAIDNICVFASFKNMKDPDVRKFI